MFYPASLHLFKLDETCGLDLCKKRDSSFFCLKLPFKSEAIYVFHAFQKKTQKTAKKDL